MSIPWKCHNIYAYKWIYTAGNFKHSFCELVRIFLKGTRRGDLEKTNIGAYAQEKLRGDRKRLRCVKLNWRETLADINGEINGRLPSPISSCTVRRRLRFFYFTRTKTRKTLTICSGNRTRRVNCCRGKLHWAVITNWKKMIFSDETCVVIEQNKRVYIWRRPDEIIFLCRSECFGVRANGKCYVLGLSHSWRSWNVYWNWWQYQFPKLH